MIITFEHNIDNVSLQVGDMAYYANANSLGVGGDPIEVGSISVVNSNSIEIQNPNSETQQDVVGKFIMFAKSNVINNVSLKGYYAEVTMRNGVTDEAELFSIGSEITESSK